MKNIFKTEAKEQLYSNCCGVEMNAEDSFCPQCKEHAEAVVEDSFEMNLDEYVERKGRKELGESFTPDCGIR